MKEKYMMTSVKGFKDIYGEELKLFKIAKNVLEEIAESFAYEEIITPIIEYSELFERSVGIDTDIVEKEMYTFMDKSGRNITLRPEITASIARSYIEHHFETKPLPLKFYYFGPCFRYEKPQKGRYRGFYQYGVEAIGDDSPLLDAEVIDIGYTIAKKLELKNVSVKINSIGCRKCRTIYKEKLKEILEPHYNELCEDCKRRFYTNPLRILDCKRESPDFKRTLPKVIDYLCDDCKKHFDNVLDYLQKMNIPYEIDNTLVRGLDYYTRTVFEVISSDLGAQNALLGGGRYDYLIEELGGRPTPAVGFALGMERLVEIMKSQGFSVREKQLIYIAYQQSAFKRAIFTAEALRNYGFKVLLDVKNGNFKNQTERSAKRNAEFTVFIGEEEVNTNTVMVKNMKNKEQIKVELANLDEFFKEQKNV
jgi:histidyl-tRNA synthetase